MNLTEFLSHFAHVRQLHPTQWTAACPAHEDRSCDTLSVATGSEDRRLVYCWAGCETDAVLDAVGLTLRDLFVGDRGPLRVVTTYEGMVASAVWDLLSRRDRLYGPYRRQWAMSHEIRLPRQAADLARRAGTELDDTEEGWEYCEAAANLDRRAHLLEMEQDAALMALRRRP